MKFRPHRHKTDFPVSIRTPAGTIKATMRNVNTGGALILTRTGVEPGAWIEIVVRGQKLQGRVKWSNDMGFGFTFDRPLSNMMLDWIRHSKRAGDYRMRFSSVGLREMS